MNPLRRLASALLSSATRGSVRLSGRAPRLALTYHRVGRGDGMVAPDVLAAQVRQARAAGWEFVTVSRMAEWAKYGTDLPPKAVALTFDDGFADTARAVAPVLSECGVTATLFPVLSFIGGPRRFGSVKAGKIVPQDDGDPQTVPYDYMTWDELDAWVEAGFEVGGHTLTHPFLGKVDETTGLAEIKGCRERLAERYGSPPRVFCYPYGDDSGRAGVWVRQAGFEAAVTSHEGIIERDSDIFHLRRLPGLATAGREWADVLSGEFLWRQRLRRWLPSGNG